MARPGHVARASPGRSALATTSDPHFTSISSRILAPASSPSHPKNADSSQVF